MSVPLTGSQGLFTRLGKVGAAMYSANRMRGNGRFFLTSLTGNGTTATATVTEPHGFTTGDTVTVAGASPSGFNGNYTITVTSTTVFTYLNSTNTTATGLVTVVKASGVPSVSARPAIDALFAQFTTTNLSVTNGFYQALSTFQGQVNGWLSALQTIANNILIGMVNSDLALTAPTQTPLSPTNVQGAMTIIAAQMTASSDTIPKPTVSASVSAGGSNSGNAVVIVSTLNSAGVAMDYLFDESLQLTCVGDSQGTATLNSEPLSLQGAQPAQAGPGELGWDWPLGSGASLRTSAVDAALSQQTSGNVLNNSSFETWSGSPLAPNNWTIDVGTAAATVVRNASPYLGTYALSFVGNGSELTTISQTFNSNTGSSVKLLPNTVYALNGYHTVTAGSTGFIRWALVDNSGNVINDASSTPNSISQDLSTLGTSYVPFNAFFRTPAVMPTSDVVKLQIKATTAIASGKTYRADYIALTPATPCYVGGPYLAIFPGNSRLILNDAWTIAIGNTYTSKWARTLEAVFNMRSIGVQLPSGGSPTIADSLLNG